MFNKTQLFVNRIACFFVFLLLFNACESEWKPIIFKTETIKKDFSADISVNYEQVTGNNQLQHKINKAIENAIVNTLGISEDKSELKTVLDDFNTEYLDFKNDFPDAAEPVWQLNVDTELSYQSDEIITIVINTYLFEGGAHGNVMIKFLNLDAKTGETLTQKDIIENEKDFQALAMDYFKKSLEHEEGDYKIEDFFHDELFYLPENMGFSEEGLILLYNVYGAFSYNQGHTEFAIPFDDAEPYLNFQ